MMIFVILFFVSILISGGFLCAYIWGVKNGQYDDVISPAERILHDQKIKKS